MKRFLCFSFAMIAALASARAQLSVSFLSPTNGATAPTPLFLEVSFGDTPPGNIVSVEYFANGQSIGIASNWMVYPAEATPQLTITDTLAPPVSQHPVPAPPPAPGSSVIFYYPFMWIWSPPPGDYTLTAQATDDQGNTAISDPVNVRVIPMPVVTVIATQPIASPGSPGDFTISRTGATTTDLSVQFYFDGNAVNGVDYYASASNAVTIPAGASSADVLIQPRAGSARPTKMVTLTLGGFAIPNYLTAAGGVSSSLIPYYPPYQLGTPYSATVYVKGNGRNRGGPAVKLSQPKPGQRFLPGSDIDITANTLDANDYVTTVNFFDGVRFIGETLNTTSTIPGTPLAFNFTWTNAPAGVHTLRALATNSHGATQFPPPVRIFVMPPRPAR